MKDPTEEKKCMSKAQAWALYAGSAAGIASFIAHAGEALHQLLHAKP